MNIYRLNRRSDKNKKPKQHSPKMFNSKQCITFPLDSLDFFSVPFETSRERKNNKMFSISHSWILSLGDALFVRWHRPSSVCRHPLSRPSLVETDTTSIDWVCRHILVTWCKWSSRRCSTTWSPKANRTRHSGTSTYRIYPSNRASHCHINRQMNICLDLLLQFKFQLNAIYFFMFRVAEAG